MTAHDGLPKYAEYLSVDPSKFASERVLFLLDVCLDSGSSFISDDIQSSAFGFAKCERDRGSIAKALTEMDPPQVDTDDSGNVEVSELLVFLASRDDIEVSEFNWSRQALDTPIIQVEP
ncbi:MAG: hypothetical protein AAF358_02900 [Pseudomonadota bacterium]